MGSEMGTAQRIISQATKLAVKCCVKGMVVNSLVRP